MFRCPVSGFRKTKRTRCSIVTRSIPGQHTCLVLKSCPKNMLLILGKVLYTSGIVPVKKGW